MIISDFRRYRIGVIWLALFAALNIFGSFFELGIKTAGLNMGLNIALLLILYYLLWVYVKVLRRERYDSLKQVIGSGDLLFIPALSPFLAPALFILFLIVSFILTLAGWGLLYIMGCKYRAIPLVGTVGLCYIAYRIYDIAL